jgi:hypothetical protein
VWTTNQRLLSARNQFSTIGANTLIPATTTFVTRQCLEEGKIEVVHVGTNDQLDDILTKALARKKFVEMRQRLGIIEVKSSHQD